MSDRKQKKELEKQKIQEFLSENKKNISSSNLDKSVQNNTQNKYQESLRPYKCPSCHKFLKSRKDPCEYCGYKGYIPMSQQETKKVRTVLFIILMIVAIAVIILTN